LEHAIELNPSLAYAYSQLGAAHYLSGKPEVALTMLAKALRLNMSEWHLYYALGEVAMSRAMLEQWPAAIEAADQAIMRRSGYWYAHVAKIHALVETGAAAEAAEAHRELLVAKPHFLDSFIDWVPFIGTDWPNRLKRSLAQAAAGAATSASVAGTNPRKGHR
jgi:tetratricopeptide (TPR) repeat protein